MKPRRILIKIWKDKLGSIMLASLVIPVLLLIGLGIKSQIINVPFKQSLNQFFFFFNSNMEIKTYWLYFADLVLIAWALFIWKKENFLGDRILRVFKENTEQSQVDSNYPHEQSGEPTYLPAHDASKYFGNRIARIFPEIKGLHWYTDPEIAKTKLSLFLAPPHEFKSKTGSNIQPIWFYRGMKNNAILRFEKLNKHMCLLNNQELNVSRIAVFRSNYKNFIYVETEASEPSGINKVSDEQIREDIKKNGFYKEYFGLTSTKEMISSEEYWDGYASIGNKVIKLEGAEERSRYLSRYNFIITDHESVNKMYREGDEYIFEGILNKILLDKASVKDLVDIVKSSRWNEYV